ncbi:unnamed protein product [Closterium sp. NIES-53]
MIMIGINPTWGIPDGVMSDVVALCLCSDCVVTFGSGGGGGDSSGGGEDGGGGGGGGSGGGSGGFGGGGGGTGGSGGSGSVGSGGGWTGAPRDRAGQTFGKLHTQHRFFSRLDDAWRAEFVYEAERPRWVELLRTGVAIFDLEFDAILAVMYALSVSAEGDCYLCVPRDPSKEAAAAAGPGGAHTRGSGAAGTGGVGGAGAGGTGARGAGAGGVGVVDPGLVLGVPPSTGLPPPLLCPPPDQSQPLLQPASPLPASSPYIEQTGGLKERSEPASRPVSPVRTGCPSDGACAANPTVSPLLATAVTDPSFESTAASALIAELVEFAAAYHLDYATALIAESVFASPPSVGGECALGTDVLEDRQEDFECLAVAGVDYFQTFSPTPKMTTLRVLLHVAAQRNYELHSLDFSTAFLQGSLHEEIWLRHPPGFTGLFPAGTQWSLRRPVYGLRQAPREWHNTMRTTLADLGFAPSTADLSLFLRTDTSLPPFYVLVYVNDLVFAAADTKALTLVKSELQKRHTCTDLGEQRSYFGLQITPDRA